MFKKIALVALISTATIPISHSTSDASPEATDAGVEAPDASQPMIADAATEAVSEAPETTKDASQGDEDLGALGGEVLELARAGKWIAALGVMMFLLIGLLRKYVFKRYEWFSTTAGGYAISGGVALLTLLGIGLKVGFSAGAVMAALSAAGLASGIHTAGKDVAKSREVVVDV